ncbi:MAG TPA: methyltransferase domain-containing protein [Vicinamibacterales bacterium]|nr:methyltransferase domain-containing protein [Vicinamibacterales bacterium]
MHGQVRDSAREVVPLVVDLLHPRRVVDVGCGTGTWLAAFAERGATEVLGLDGEYVDRTLLDIPMDRFVPADLTQPVRQLGRYDLALCLEVAEHLPASRAAGLVNDLTNLAPVVLFSAAIPLQSGVNHINEQWPEYWASLFRNRGFVPIDCIRRTVWQNSKVAWFYAQNMLLYADERHARSHALLASQLAGTNIGQLAMVHPSCFVSRVWAEHDLANRPLRQILAALPGLSRKAFRRQLRRLLPNNGGRVPNDH